IGCEQRRGLLRSAPRGIAMDRPPGAARSEDPDAAHSAPATPAGTAQGYECLVFVTAVPVVVRTPRRSVRPGVGVARVAPAFTTGGWRGAATSLTFALA